MRIEKLKQKIRTLNIDAQEIASTLDDLKSVKSVREVDLELQASIQATAAHSHMYVSQCVGPGRSVRCHLPL